MKINKYPDGTSYVTERNPTGYQTFKINSYCKIADYIFIFKGFKIEDNEVYVKFVDKNTPEGYTNHTSLSWWLLKYDSVNFKNMRYAFITLKGELKKIGLEINKIKEL